LVIKTHELVEDWIYCQFIYDHAKDGLLHILHASRFDGDDPRCLERFRYGDDPYGSFPPRFESVHTLGFTPLMT
jgi:hypothetical protein